MCATSAHVDCHYRRRPLKIVSHSRIGAWDSSLNFKNNELILLLLLR